MKTKGRYKQFLSLLILVVVCCGLIQVYKELNYFRLREGWKKTTTPLPQNRVSTLCKNFGLEISHEFCDGDGDVYGPEFYDLIIDTFKPKLTYRGANDVSSTYQQVEKLIGEFRIGCEPNVWDEYDQKYYYQCDYDLRGDGKYLIHITYEYPENSVYDIVARKGKEPHD